MNKIDKIIKILCSFLIGVIIGFVIYNLFFTPKEISNLSNDKIDSLEMVIENISSKKDSIQKEIDTVYIKLTEIKEEHETNVNIILSNNVSEDYEFFAEYVNNFSGYIDSNNSSTTKNN